MPQRLQYHFEPQQGWMNDPNGLIYFQGKYHAFFQHYPHKPKWGQMHWAHAVSDDLISWTELPIALYPDQPYENDGGCFSGSAIEKDGILYLFYTSVSKELGQTQSVAFSKDGIHFEKYRDNPIIRTFPPDGGAEFRDPKVVKINGVYYMVCGSGKDGVGKILLYTSADLFYWDYVGVLFAGREYGKVLECPDFFPFEDKYLLLFSQMNRKTHATMFVYGDFDGTQFTPISFHTPEAGPHFYAPQTFLDDRNRRILIAWLYSWNKKLDKGADYAGALTIPRELCMKEGTLQLFPVEEAHVLLQQEDELVAVENGRVSLKTSGFRKALQYIGEIRDIHIIRDTKTIEVFINQGQASFSYWFGK